MSGCSLLSPHLSSPIIFKVLFELSLFFLSPCFCSPLIFPLFRSPTKESLASCLPPPPPPPPSSLSIPQFVSVQGEITIRLLSSVNHSNGGGRGREKEEERVNDLCGGGAANDFHLIAPPPLLESGAGWREEDERGTEWEKESANDDRPFSL